MLLVDFNRFEDPAHGKETWLKRTHGRLLRKLFDRPLLLAPGIAVLLAIGYLAYLHVGNGFLPQMDEGGFVLDYYTAPGTSLAETKRELGEVEGILRKNAYVYTYSRRAGAASVEI